MKGKSIQDLEVHFSFSESRFGRFQSGIDEEGTAQIFRAVLRPQL